MNGFSSRAACLSLLSLPLLLCGCTTTFGENHYFYSEKDGVTQNYFRLKVSGHALMTSARYISGYYDERAVDLYFDEIKTSHSPSAVKWFRDDLKGPGSDEKIRPLTPGAQNGALVMVLSTNADAVVNAIGQFAENQLVADAVTNLANRDLLRASEAFQNSNVAAGRAAAAKEIAELMGQLPNPSSANSSELETSERKLLRVLASIARARGMTTPFTSLAEAEAWVRSERVRYNAEVSK